MGVVDRMVRAGDVLLYPIPEIPSFAQETSNHILAYGEKSGHKHLVKGQVQVFETRVPEPMQTLSLRKVLAKKFVKVLQSTLMQPTVLVHENKKGQQADHKPRVLQPGSYMVIQEKEWQPFEEMVKTVED